MSMEKDPVPQRETEVLSRGSSSAPSSLGIGGYLCIRVPLLSKAREMKVRVELPMLLLWFILKCQAHPGDDRFMSLILSPLFPRL